MTKQDIQQVLEKKSLRIQLYVRGFLFTDAEINENVYPFYGEWKIDHIHKYTLLYSPLQKCYRLDLDGKFYLLIGHAYDPFSMSYDENEILTGLSECNNHVDFFEKINQLTGMFSIIWGGEDSISFLADACCIQNVFYSSYKGHLYISSHTNLINDILGLQCDNYISKLVSYRFFNLLGNYLPGNLTQFKEVRRLVPNHVLTYIENRFEIHRFYTPHRADLSFEQIRDSASAMLHNNLQLIAKKWKKPAISLTGGCDSKTTLACANGLYDKFKYFSYISDEAEAVDANAAHKICEKLGLEHIIYHIPDNDDDVGDVRETAKLLRWNTGDVRNSNPNDVRKRSVLLHQKDFDVEVKSWCSEIARAYYSKRFAGKTNFGNKPKPRVATTLYKFFLTERGLVRKTDKVFEQYFNDWFKSDDTVPIEWQEQFFWEFRVAAWNGLVITGEHQYTNEITIPYNNRRCLELMLSIPIKDRLSDELYKAIRDKMNAKIDTIVPTVVNLRHTALRARFEWLYYYFNIIAP